jgi:hypothetical protein
MKCPTCKAETETLLIDCSLPLGSQERESRRWCYICRPEARHRLAGYPPRMLAKMGLPEDVLQAALKARRWVADRSASYPLSERIFDLNARATKGRA